MEFVLWNGVLHVAVALKRTCDISLSHAGASGNLDIAAHLHWSWVSLSVQYVGFEITSGESETPERLARSVMTMFIFPRLFLPVLS